VPLSLSLFSLSLSSNSWHAAARRDSDTSFEVGVQKASEAVRAPEIHIHILDVRIGGKMTQQNQSGSIKKG